MLDLASYLARLPVLAQYLMFLGHDFTARLGQETWLFLLLTDFKAVSTKMTTSHSFSAGKSASEA